MLLDLLHSAAHRALAQVDLDGDFIERVALRRNSTIFLSPGGRPLVLSFSVPVLAVPCSCNDTASPSLLDGASWQSFCDGSCLPQLHLVKHR